MIKVLQITLEFVKPYIFVGYQRCVFVVVVVDVDGGGDVVTTTTYKFTLESIDALYVPLEIMVPNYFSLPCILSSPISSI